jgi:hypothetical protein
MSTNDEEKKNEWLQFMEFIKRKYGNNSSEYIRINHYNKRANNSVSVAQYYSSQVPSANINPNTKLDQLLKNTKFLELLKLNHPEEVSKFTEIYNNTDYLMKTLNSKDDNLYIKCNPVDDNGISIESSNNMYGPNLNSLNSMLTEGSNLFSPSTLYNNIGLQVFVSILFVGIIYSIGNFMFVVYPSSYTKNRAKDT